MKESSVPPASESTSPLYPVLPGTPSIQPYRLHEISQLRNHLEDEREKREVLYKKYRRAVNALDSVEAALLTASMGIGVGGIGLLSTIIAAPVVLGLEIAALACGIFGASGKFIGRRLAVKAKKHDNIRGLAESKLNTISDHVSNALIDGQISDEEFRRIISEVNKYAQMKAAIRVGAGKAHAGLTLDEETRNSLIQLGRKEAKDSFIKKLSSL